MRGAGAGGYKRVYIIRGGVMSCTVFAFFLLELMSYLSLCVGFEELRGAYMWGQIYVYDGKTKGRDRPDT